LLGIVCAGRKGYNNEDWGGKNCWKGEEVITVKTMKRWRLGRNKSWETGLFVLRAISGQGHDRKKRVTPGHDRKEESYTWK